MRLQISHRTDYRYSEPVSQSHHVLHLSPRPHASQAVLRHAVTVAPVEGGD